MKLVYGRIEGIWREGLYTGQGTIKLLENTQVNVRSFGDEWNFGSYKANGNLKW